MNTYISYASQNKTLTTFVQHFLPSVLRLLVVLNEYHPTVKVSDVCEIIDCVRVPPANSKAGLCCCQTCETHSLLWKWKINQRIVI